MTDVHSLEVLEYSKIVSLVSRFTLSRGGFEGIVNSPFLTDEKAVSEMRSMVESVAVILTEDEFREPSFPEINEIMAKVSKSGTVLEGTELVTVSLYIESAYSSFSYFKSRNIDDCLRNNISCDDPIPVCREIRKHFQDDGSINPKLPDIKKIILKIAELEKKNEAIVRKYLNDWNDYLQFSNPSFKDGRVVFPVKSDRKNQAKGIIHQVSQTGNTVFVEPFELLDNNNDLIQSKSELGRLIFLYCRRMTELVFDNLELITGIIEKFSFFDSLYARACFMNRYLCVFPEIIKEGIDIRQARHLLIENEPVPLDLFVISPVMGLVVTGSNAGGKTVALKTAGLVILMNQAVFPVPAAEGSRMQFFDFLSADIGDSQSLEQAISTFTGHITRIREILANKKKNGIVLLDELGTGTSDEEGGALGVSLLKNIIKNSNSVIVTTHNKRIKEFAFSSDSFEIASVRFNDERHVPEFGLSYGIHGESHGIDTAIQCGLPGFIINEAKKILESGKTDLDKALEKIQKIEETLSLKESELYEKEKELARIINDRKKEIEKYNGAREDFNHRIEEILINTNRKIDEIRQKNIKISKKDEKEIKNELYSEFESGPAAASAGKLVKIEDKNLTEGMTVTVGSLKKEGKLIRKLKNNNWQVRVGDMKLVISTDDIFQGNSGTGMEKKIVIDRGISVENARYNLDLRGYTINEAIEVIEKQIDRMLVSGQKYFSVIHGHGPLENALTAWFRKQKAVLEYNYAAPASGGKGKTIITLDI